MRAVLNASLLLLGALRPVRLPPRAREGGIVGKTRENCGRFVDSNGPKLFFELNPLQPCRAPRTSGENQNSKLTTNDSNTNNSPAQHGESRFLPPSGKAARSRYCRRRSTLHGTCQRRGAATSMRTNRLHAWSTQLTCDQGHFLHPRPLPPKAYRTRARHRHSSWKPKRRWH